MAPGIPRPIYGSGVGLNVPGVAIAARHRRKRKRIDAIVGITKPAIRRLARRGGVKRIQVDIYGTVRAVLQARLRTIMFRITETLHCSGSSDARCRKTITTDDVVFALNALGTPIYDYSWPDTTRP